MSKKGNVVIVIALVIALALPALAVWIGFWKAAGVAFVLGILMFSFNLMDAILKAVNDE